MTNFALSAIAPSGPIERAAARVLLYAYKRRLRGVVAVAPPLTARG